MATDPPARACQVDGCDAAPSPAAGAGCTMKVGRRKATQDRLAPTSRPGPGVHRRRVRPAASQPGLVLHPLQPVAEDRHHGRTPVEAHGVQHRRLRPQGVGPGWCFLHYHRWVRTGDPGDADLLRPRAAPLGCSVEGCDRPHQAKGLCDTHYSRLRKTGTTDRLPRVCGVVGCARPYQAKGFCGRHYDRWLRTGDPGSADLDAPREPRPCAVSGCDQPQRSKGCCQSHYQRWRGQGTLCPGRIHRMSARWTVASRRSRPVGCATSTTCDGGARSRPAGWCSSCRSSGSVLVLARSLRRSS